MLSRLPSLKPGGLFALQVRFNCPWHRNNYRTNYFPFYFYKKLRMRSVPYYMSIQGGRRQMMRNVLMENYFIGWNWPSKPAEKRLSYPL